MRKCLRRRQRYIVRMHAERAGRSRGTSLGKSWALLPGVQRGRAFHYLDGVYVEFAGEAGFGLALAETEHADAGNQTTVGLASRMAGESGWANAL